MKSDEESLLSRVTGWLSNTKKYKNSSNELERLRSEQLRLATEFESLLSSYDEQTKTLSDRLIRAEEEPLTKREISKLEEEQKRLWRIIRRLQACDRTAAQLEQEYLEWKSRNSEGIEASHPDHPELRAEFVASELRTRGRGVPEIPVRKQMVYEGSAKDVDPFVDLDLNDETPEVDEGVVEEEPTVEPVTTLRISSEIRQTLIDEIRECGRQLRKQHANPDVSPEELVSLYAELRHHHASLRQVDRRSGVRRYRVGLHEL